MSRPEQHTCCSAARRYLIPRISDREWHWYIKVHTDPTRRAQDPVRITFCPWCGQELPLKGRLVITEVKEGGEHDADADNPRS